MDSYRDLVYKLGHVFQVVGVFLGVIGILSSPLDTRPEGANFTNTKKYLPGPEGDELAFFSPAHSVIC
jgi:hypothetical protein